MPDPVTAVVLAHSAVQLLTPYLIEAAKAGAGEVGKGLAKSLGGAASTLRDQIRARLSRHGSVTALERYEAAPADAGRRGALEYAMELALDADPEWRATIAGLVDRLGAEVHTGAQGMHIEGKGNVGAQVAGAGNHVTIQHSTPRDG